MDPVTTALVAAASSALNDLASDVVKDAYKAAKQAIKKKFGISKAVEDLEAAPDSKQHQTRLSAELSAKNAAADPELIALAQRLIDAIQETEAGRKSLGKYNIQASGAQVGVIGDGIRIEGGIHYHNYGLPSGGAAPARPASEGAAPQAEAKDEVPVHLLHLSDLHFGTAQDARRWHSQLASDLKQELDCHRLDAIIVSGDVANRAVTEEYAAARVFMQRLCETFGVDLSNLVIVPGNHDLNWALSEDAYTPIKRNRYTGTLREGAYIEESEALIQLRDDALYGQRFEPFSQFYQAIKGTPYPLEHARQGVLYHLKSLDLLVLGLNSAWQVDHHFTSRAAICPDAIATALEAVLQNPVYAGCLKLAVWHHPISSACEDRITDHGFLELLAQNGFSVCFHGHLHKTTSDLFRYDHSVGGRRIEIVGAGTFGAPTKEWASGFPLQYNLLKVTRRQMTIKTRCRQEINGAWKPHAIWRQGPGKDPSSSYTIDLAWERRPNNVEYDQSERSAAIVLPTDLKDTVCASAPPEPRPNQTVADLAPGGAMEAQCPFYIERQADAEVLAGVSRHRGLVTLQGPNQTGKTSMMLRLYTQSRGPESKPRPVIVDFQALPTECFESLPAVWHAILREVDAQLNIGRLDEQPWQAGAYYDRHLTTFLEQFVFKHDFSPVMLCMDEVNRVFAMPVRSSFFPSVRSFFNRGAYDAAWKNIRWMLSTSSEPRFFIEDLNQSPFNVGTRVSVGAFDLAQTAEFVRRCGFPTDREHIGRIMTYLGGQPYLVHLLLHHMRLQPGREAGLFDAASAGHGVFKPHLGHFLAKFQEQADLAAAMKRVIAGKGCPDVRLADRLSAAGLAVEDDEGKVVCACELYAVYLGRRL